jgi:HlyD family secretion protein
VEIGTTNGVTTEIVSGINEGTEVLTDFEIEGPAVEMPGGQQAQNPFMPRPGRGRNQQQNQQQRR